MSNIILAPHQMKAIRELSNGKILRAGVGSGKSRVSIVYYYTKVCGGRIKINNAGESIVPANFKDLYIITTAKKREDLEWHKELADVALYPTAPDEIHEEANPLIVVDSWNNIQKYIGVKDAFFIFDEQRLVGNGAWVKAFYKLAKQNQWIILSATPGDDWMDYIPVFVANGFFKNRTEFMRNHVIFNRFAKYPKVDRYIGTGRLESLRRSVLVHMPYSSNTKRRIVNRIVKHDEDRLKLLREKRWNEYTDEPIKDAAELFRTARRIVNDNPYRIEEVRKLWMRHPRLIIFYNFNYELMALRAAIQSWIEAESRSEITGLSLSKTLPLGMNPSSKRSQLAEWNGHKHDPLPVSDRWVYLVQYTAGAEGWNCTTTDAMVFYSMTYSYKQFEQAQGRIDRMNTPYKELHYYVLRSNSWIDGAIASALKKKKNFNESAYLKNIGESYD